MGQLILGVAGAAGAFALGVSPSIGFAVGSAIGGAIFQKDLPTIRNRQQQLSDLRVVGTEYGQAIPYLIGSSSLAGQMWWNTDRRPISTTTSQTTGGKGGAPEQTTETTTITYDMDCLIGLTDNEIAGIARIWDNGKLIFTSDGAATAESLAASASAETWDRITVYTGSLSQLPDPTYEAAIVAEGKRPAAYRGRSYVFIQGLKLGQSGSVRNLTFEVVADGTAGSSTEILEVISGVDADDKFAVPSGSTCVTYDGLRGSGKVWGHRIHDGVDSLVLIDAVTGSLLLDIPSTDFSPTAQLTAIPVGIDPDGSAYVATTGASLRFYRVSTSGDLDYIDTVLNLASRGLVMDANGHLWGSDGATKVVYRINSPNFSGHTCTESPTSGAANTMENEFCRNATGIAGRVYFIGLGPDFAIRYADISSLACTEVVAETGGDRTIIGDDGNIYTTFPVAGDTEVRKYSADGTLLDTLTLDDLQIVQMYDSSGFLWVSKRADAGDYFKIDPVTMTVVDTIENETFRDIVAEPVNGALAVLGNDEDPFSTLNTGGLGLLQTLETVTKECVSVATAVSRLCLRSGLAADQFNVVALSAITREVCSLAISQVTSTRTPLELLMANYFFELTESDKIYFKPRGESSVASIPYLDLGATVGNDDPEPLELRLGNDLELPAQIASTYINIDNDYQPDTQYSDRLISAASGTVSVVQMAIGLHANEAKQVADVMLLDQTISLLTTRIALLGDYCRLEPTDVVLVTGKDGSVFRMRLVQKTDAYPLLQFDAVLDDASILSSQGITSTDFSPQTVVAASVDTVMRLLDIPILQDADDNAGHYVVVKGDGTPYPGSAVFDSPDDVSYTQRATIRESAIFGTCTTALGDWTGVRVFDEINTVRVNVGDATLASSTRDAVLANQAVNAFVIGDELIQAVTATLVSPGVYDLTSLLRGSRGTELAMTGHASGERCVLLREFGMRRIVLTNSQLGIERYYVGVTLGRPISSGSAQRFTNNGISLKPFSPQGVRVDRDGSGNITFTVDRRSRFSVRTVGLLGISVPLAEEVEQYEIDVYAIGSPNSLVRTIIGPHGTNVLTYSAASQVADFGSLPSMGDMLISTTQISAEVGRGYPLEQAA